MQKDADRILDAWEKGNSPEWQSYMATNKLKKDPRRLKCGGRMRQLSVDELTQVFNILETVWKHFI